jgi:hypothetical protein
MCKECEEKINKNLNNNDIKRKVCKICNEEKYVTDFKSKVDKRNGRNTINYSNKCRVCEYLEKHNDVNYLNNYWSYDEYLILIDKIINCKIEYINDLKNHLDNKSIADIIFFVHENSLKFGSSPYLLKTNCKTCGEELILQARKYKESGNFCSRECGDIDYSKNYSGKNSHLYSRVKTKCVWCNKEIEIHQYRYNASENNFCDKVCFNEWFRNVFVKTEEYIIRNRETMLKNLSNGSINKTNTSIQIKINELLDNMNISYENEKTISFYSVDNYLIDSNLIIEVNGDFFHCNPTIYSNIGYEMQVNRIIRDKAKKTRIKTLYDVNILYLWENDINKNIDLCRELIKIYIKNKGKLRNYNSYNYKIENEKLIINKDIVKAYCDTPKEILNEIIDTSIKESKEFYLDVICDCCGKEYVCLISQYNKSKVHFCSIDCRKKYRKDEKKKRAVIHKCDHCGEEFVRLDYKEQRNTLKRYCSQECKAKDQMNRVITNCGCCNKEVSITKARYDKSNKKIFFCDKDCYNEYMKNKNTTFPCDCCGKMCTVNTSKYNKTKHHFCDKNCEKIYKLKFSLRNDKGQFIG